MLHAHAVAQMHAVRFARPPAVEEGRPLRHERREDAVLHVKHRHVLVQRQLEPRGRRRGEQIEHLLDVQIVADRHALQPVADEILRGQRVGDVERKVADLAQRALSRKCAIAPRLRMSTPSGAAFSISLKKPCSPAF